jgi:hypothetical protein
MVVTKDVREDEKKGRPTVSDERKTILAAEVLPDNNHATEIILLKIDGARAKKKHLFM